MASEDPLARVAKLLTPRGIGYVIYILLIEPSERAVFVVDTEEEKEALKQLLDSLLPEVRELTKRPGFHIKIPEPEVVTREEYEKRWREFAGARIAMIKEEMSLRAAAVDFLERVVRDALERTKLFWMGPVDRLRERVLEILGRADEVYAHALKVIGERGAFDDRVRKDIEDFLSRTVTVREEIPLIWDILKFRGVIE